MQHSFTAGLAYELEVCCEGFNQVVRYRPLRNCSRKTSVTVASN